MGLLVVLAHLKWLKPLFQGRLVAWMGLESCAMLRWDELPKELEDLKVSLLEGARLLLPGDPLGLWLPIIAIPSRACICSWARGAEPAWWFPCLSTLSSLRSLSSSCSAFLAAKGSLGGALRGGGGARCLLLSPLMALEYKLVNL